jgi:endonuclease/exonuclease/phosphatase family metal-dependent hydrolase
MTYNVLYGGVGRERLIRDVVGAIDPHMAIFTEATPAKSFDSIADVVGPYRARGGGPAARECPVIVSRWPIVHSEQHGPPWAPMKWIEATINPFGGPPITVHGIQLAPQPLWPCELFRYCEVGYLLKHLARTSGEHVVAGDFNALAVGDEHRLSRAPSRVRAQWLLQAGMVPRWALGRLMNAGYVDCYRACNGHSNGFTVPAWDPQARIDYVFASRKLRTALRASGVPQPSASGDGHRPAPRRSLAELLGWTAVKSLNGEASDHLPVWADFDWPGSAA